MPELRVFCDLFSQPCRAVVLFLEANKIPYESVPISLAEGKKVTINNYTYPPINVMPHYHRYGLRVGDGRG